MGLHAHELTRVVGVFSSVWILRAKIVTGAFLTSVIASRTALAARFRARLARLGVEVELNLGRFVETKGGGDGVEVERVHVVDILERVRIVRENVRSQF